MHTSDKKQGQSLCHKQLTLYRHSTTIASSGFIILVKFTCAVRLLIIKVRFFSLQDFIRRHFNNSIEIFHLQLLAKALNYAF